MRLLLGDVLEEGREERPLPVADAAEKELEENVLVLECGRGEDPQEVVRAVDPAVDRQGVVVVPQRGDSARVDPVRNGGLDELPDEAGSLASQ